MSAELLHERRVVVLQRIRLSCPLFRVPLSERLLPLLHSDVAEVR